MSEARVNVLLSSAGRRVHLMKLLQTTLQELVPAGRVFAADRSELAAACHLADGSVTVPAVLDEGFGAAIAALCVERAVKLVVPTIDTELAPYAALAPLLAEEGTVVSISSPEVIEICSSKRRTNGWLRDHGYPVPVRYERDEALAAVERGPLIVKPDRGSSSIGVFAVHDAEELEMALRRPDVVIEELVSGEEYTVDVFVDATGRATSPVPRLRLEVRAGEVSKGLTVHLPHVEALVARIAEDLPGARGCLNVQLVHDPRTGRIAVLEINARFGGGYPLTHHAGAPYVRWLLEEALGLESSIPSSPTWRSNTLMLRYDDAVFVEDWRA
jgi:carbamoyl-phosphate synthase large subunit